MSEVFFFEYLRKEKWRGRVENQPQVKRPSLLQHEILADVAYGSILLKKSQV
jgi:hypothetical protein